MIRPLQRAIVERVEAAGVASAERLARSGFDVLVTDLHLGDGTGWELHHRLNQVRPIAAIAITASASPEDAARNLAAGFCEHLDKPVTFETLRAAIECCTPRAGTACRSSAPRQHCKVAASYGSPTCRP
jgi:CheY-like chemotaxis protein